MPILGTYPPGSGLNVSRLSDREIDYLNELHDAWIPKSKDLRHGLFLASHIRDGKRIEDIAKDFHVHPTTVVNRIRSTACALAGLLMHVRACEPFVVPSPESEDNSRSIVEENKRKMGRLATTIKTLKKEVEFLKGCLFDLHQKLKNTEIERDQWKHDFTFMRAVAIGHEYTLGIRKLKGKRTQAINAPRLDFEI